MQTAPRGEIIFVGAPLCLIETEGKVNNNITFRHSKGIAHDRCAVYKNFGNSVTIIRNDIYSHLTAGSNPSITCTGGSRAVIVHVNGNLIFGNVNGVGRITCKDIVYSAVVFIIETIVRGELYIFARQGYVRARVVRNSNICCICVIGEVKRAPFPKNICVFANKGAPRNGNRCTTRRNCILTANELATLDSQR